MSDNKKPLKKEDEQFSEQLAIIKKSTDEAMENTRKSLSGVDFSQMAKMRETYIRNITPTIKAMASTFEQYHEISKRISQTLAPPMLEIQKQMLVITDPLGDFQKRMSEISSKIYDAIKKLSNPAVILMLAENQFVHWNYFSRELVDVLSDSKDANQVMMNFYKQDNFSCVNNTIELIRIELSPMQKQQFEQSILAYNQNWYDVSILGLLTISDRLLSDFSQSPNSTSFYKRAEILLEIFDDNGEIEDDNIYTFILTYTFIETIKSLSTNTYKFGIEEPKCINRDWYLHGRYQSRTTTQLDCIKIINLIYGMILIDKLGEDEVTTYNE